MQFLPQNPPDILPSASCWCSFPLISLIDCIYLEFTCLRELVWCNRRRVFRDQRLSLIKTAMFYSFDNCHISSLCPGLFLKRCTVFKLYVRYWAIILIYLDDISRWRKGLWKYVTFPSIRMFEWLQGIYHIVFSNMRSRFKKNNFEIVGF